MNLKTKLKNLSEQNPNLKTLFSMVREEGAHLWLVGGCLRDLLLDLPAVDIDLASTGDPTALARSWSAQVDGRWFWLDPQRFQSRVLLKNGLIVDFSPLRASTITEDQLLRDYTINSLALPLFKPLPEACLLDPLHGLNHLQSKQLVLCSSRSISDDPLRLLKGVRHAVTLGFSLSPSTIEMMKSSGGLLSNVAGERIRDELFKILAAEEAVAGIQFLNETGLLRALWGPPDHAWSGQAMYNELASFAAKIREIEQTTESHQDEPGKPDPFSYRVLFLLARILNQYSPQNLSGLLHDRLRLSRYQQRLIENLQCILDFKLFSLASSVTERRCQALVVEQMEPFSFEKMLYWGVCHNLLKVDKILELRLSFAAEQVHGRVPDLLNGHQLALYLKKNPHNRIGSWQHAIKLAEITGEIKTPEEAEDWLKKEIII